MTRDGDFEFDLPFRHAVFTSIEQKNLYESMTPKKALRAGIDPPRPTFAILSDYIDEKIAGVMRKDPLDAARALRELNWVLHSLVYGIKHPEFKKTLETVEAARATIGEFLRQHLVKSYRDPATPKEDLPIINEALVYIIECGGWPTWQEDIAEWEKPERGDDDDCAA